MSSNSILKQIVNDIESVEGTIKDLNDEKSGKYKEAKSKGYDVKALRRVIAIRRKGIEKHEEEENTVGLYLAELG